MPRRAKGGGDREPTAQRSKALGARVVHDRVGDPAEGLGKTGIGPVPTTRGSTVPPVSCPVGRDHRWQRAGAHPLYRARTRAQPVAEETET